jgi:hypothetical protein
MTSKMKKAIEKVGRKLMNMPKEQFAAELKKHEYSDTARALMYAFDPEMKDEYWKKIPKT